MSETKETENTRSESKNSEEDILLLKNDIHSRISTTVTFAEIVHIINSMLLQEVEDRVGNMSDEEISAEITRIKAEQKQAEQKQAEPEESSSGEEES